MSEWKEGKDGGRRKAWVEGRGREKDMRKERIEDKEKGGQRRKSMRDGGGWQGGRKARASAGGEEAKGKKRWREEEEEKNRKEEGMEDKEKGCQREVRVKEGKSEGRWAYGERKGRVAGRTEMGRNETVN